MLYTRKGDKGTTKFFPTKGRKRISKASLVAEALGSLDEVNSFIGLCKVKAQESDLRVGKQGLALHDILETIQQNLFIAQAELVGAKKKILKRKVTEMEKIIDTIDKEIPPITSFSIPGGVELSSLLDVARTVARRMERNVTTVCDAKERKVSIHTRSYLNRLSSLLFALARLVNCKSGIKEKKPHYR